MSESSRRGIYVEHLIDAPMEAIWSHTQDPELHERWDLRFTDIDYLPKHDPDQPQRFRYATRLGFGIAVVGDGESVGEHDGTDGSRSSALRFGSGQARSLIREGSGYWKYIQTPAGVRFLTWYDYRTRGGVAGRAADRIFRPLLGWATAWSFDRLRLWLERGIEPGQAARQAVAHGFARVGLAAIFAYQGIVPKLLGPADGEIAMVAATGLESGLVRPAVLALGVLEVAFAVILLVAWHRASPAYVAIAIAIGTTVGVALTSPGTLGTPFNPIALNLGVLGLALSDRATLDGIPSAGRCRRQPAGSSAATPDAVMEGMVR